MLPPQPTLDFQEVSENVNITRDGHQCDSPNTDSLGSIPVSAPKRGRGRPRKLKTPISGSYSQGDINTPPANSKRRGRKPKGIVTDPTGVAETRPSSTGEILD